MSIRVATHSHWFVCGVRLFRGLPSKQWGPSRTGIRVHYILTSEPSHLPRQVGLAHLSNAAMDSPVHGG